MSPRKLTDDDVRQIKRAIDQKSDRVIAAQFGISAVQVEAIAVGHMYADVRLPPDPRPSLFHPRARPRAGR